MQIWNDIKRSYQSGNMTMRIIYANIAVFIIAKLIAVFITITGTGDGEAIIYNWLAIPASPTSIIYRLWTILTYQFLHLDFLHILFNMLWLYWFGNIFLQLYNRRQMLSVYLWGGLWGAALYALAFNLIPYYSENIVDNHMLGASAAILAIVVATATASPNQNIRLALIGNIKLKYMAIGVVLIDLTSITSTTNSGGHIAHIGGAIAGYWFANEYLKKNNDITAWIAKIVDYVVTRFSNKGKATKPKMKARHTGGKQAERDFNKKKQQELKSIDKTLEKIKISGYDSLSKSEKEQLFKASK